jgi:hypothetical protein
MAKYNYVCGILTLLFIVLLSILFVRREGFIGDPYAAQCGVARPACAPGTACMNGWCVGTNPPALPPNTGLPVLPTSQEQSTVMRNFRA